MLVLNVVDGPVSGSAVFIEDLFEERDASVCQPCVLPCSPAHTDPFRFPGVKMTGVHDNDWIESIGSEYRKKGDTIRVSDGTAESLPCTLCFGAPFQNFGQRTSARVTERETASRNGKDSNVMAARCLGMS